MDFFEAQDIARRRSRRLIALFIASVLGIIAVLYIVAHIAVIQVSSDHPARYFDPILFAVVAVSVILTVGAGSGYRTLQLRRGGPAVAELLGGRRVDPATEDIDERRLVNVVEEMAIASGIPLPAIYILDSEEGINAFAAGHSPEDAAVAVTRGTLMMLTRDELQGVIAHEFSHIFNGDMRLNIRLMGLLFGILLIAVIGRIIIQFGPRGGQRGSSGRRGGDSRIVLIGIALFLAGYVGVFFGRLIQAAISRQREYLADAAAVQFTRNPEGIAGALRKIETSIEGGGPGSRIGNVHAEEAGHLFFARGLGGLTARLFASHPPLGERIRRVEGQRE